MSPMMDAAVMADHFDSINKLPEGVAGVPNWRCVPGYQVQSYFRYYCGPGAKVPVKPDSKNFLLRFSSEDDRCRGPSIKEKDHLVG